MLSCTRSSASVGLRVRRHATAYIASRCDSASVTNASLSLFFSPGAAARNIAMSVAFQCSQPGLRALYSAERSDISGFFSTKACQNDKKTERGLSLFLGSGLLVAFELFFELLDARREPLHFVLQILKGRQESGFDALVDFVLPVFERLFRGVDELRSRRRGRRGFLDFFVLRSRDEFADRTFAQIR